MARHRTHPVALKRQIAQEHLSGEVSLHGLAKRNDIRRNLIASGSASTSAASSTTRSKLPICSSSARRASQLSSAWRDASRSGTTS